MYSHMQACFRFRSKYAKPWAGQGLHPGPASSPLAQALGRIDRKAPGRARPGFARGDPEVSAGSWAAKDNSHGWGWQAPGTQLWVLSSPRRSWQNPAHSLAGPSALHLWYWQRTELLQQCQGCKGWGWEFSPGQTLWPVLAVSPGFCQVRQNTGTSCSALSKSMV